MGQINAAARYRELGNELRKLREAAGLTGRQVAVRTGWSTSKISRIEIGKLELSTVDVVHYLGACEIMRGQALDLLAEFRDAERRHDYWLSPHGPGLEDSACALIYHESTANVSTCFEPQVVPGLLQTEAYIRALTADQWPEWDLDRAARIRMERQEILHRPFPAQFTFLISEQALRLEVGGQAVMYEQLLALMLIDALPHVVIQVVPASATFGGAFRLFEFAKYQPLVYLDAYFGGLFLEDKEYVDDYRELTPVIAEAALDEGQSRQFVAALADEYDRGSAHNHVEEEQL